MKDDDVKDKVWLLRPPSLGISKHFLWGGVWILSGRTQ